MNVTVSSDDSLGNEDSVKGAAVLPYHHVRVAEPIKTENLDKPQHYLVDI